MAQSNFLQFQILNGFSGNEWLAVAAPTTPGAQTFMMNRILSSNIINFSAGTTPQSANTVYAGPTGGGAAAPSFRLLVNADIPTLTTLNWTGGGTETVSGGNTITWTGISTFVFGGTGSFTSTVAGTNAGVFLNTADNANNRAARFESDRASPAVNDGVLVGFYLSDSAGNQDEFGRITVAATDVTSTSEDGVIFFAVANAGTLAQNRMRMDATVLAPLTTDTMSLGSSSLNWSDLFLDLGAVINFDSGDVTITHSANRLDFANATTGYFFDSAVDITRAGTPFLCRNINDLASVTAAIIEGDRATPANLDTALISLRLSNNAGTQTEYVRFTWRADDVAAGSEDGTLLVGVMNAGTIVNRLALNATSLNPNSNDAAALGTGGVSWADLFLADGAVVNWNNGGATITYNSGGDTLAFAGATAYSFDNFTQISQAVGATTASLNAKNTTDNAAVKAITIEGDRATPAAFDGVYISAVLSDSIGTQEEFCRLTAQAQVVTSGSEQGRWVFQMANGAGVLTSYLILQTAALFPTVTDTISLGTSALNFSDLFLDSGAVINFDSGDMIITHSADRLAFSGAAGSALQSYTFDNSMLVTTSTSNVQQALRLTNTNDNASVRPLIIEGDRATPAANDVVFVSWLLSDSVGTQTEFGRYDCRATTVTDAAETGMFRFWLMDAGTLTEKLQLITTALRPTSNNVLSLGIATVAWTSLFLANAGVVNFSNGDVTVTHSTNLLSFAGAASGYAFDNPINITTQAAATPSLWVASTNDTATITIARFSSARATPAANDRLQLQFNMNDTTLAATTFGRIEVRATDVTDASEDGEFRFAVMVAATLTERLLLTGAALSPVTTDTVSLGTSTLNFSDLFLDLGGVINFDNGDVTVTHSANALSFAGAANGYVFDSLVDITRAGAVLQVHNITDSSTVTVAIFEGDRAAPAASDVGLIDLRLSNAAGTQIGYARLNWRADDVTAGSEDGTLIFSVMNAGTLANRLLINATTVSCSVNDAAALGSTAVMWADLFLASGAVVNFNNGNVTLTHASAQLSIAGGTLALAAGTTTIEPLQFTSGTNLTTAAAGAVEYDGISFYATSVASSRQVVNAEQVSALTTTFAGSDVNTAQPVFSAAQDAITLAATTSYEFEAYYYFTRAAGTNSHTTATLFGGTATFTSIGYMACCANPTGNNLATVSTIQGTGAGALVVTAANTSATENVAIWLRGVIRVNAGGTLIPQIQYSAAPGGAPTFQTNSFFRIWPIGTNTVASVGNWA